MAEKKDYTEKEKIAHYKKRAADKSLSEGQREFAENRLFELTGGKQGKKSGRHFSQAEKREHFRGVSKGEIPVKTPSKFGEQSQKDYAKGQVNARDELAGIYGRSNFPDKEARKAYIESKNAKNG